MEPVATDPSTAYRGVADAWARGPAALYDRLASLTLAGVSNQLRGKLVLDVGAGTGALCRALQMAGATAVALDTSRDMLRLIGDTAALSLAGDMCVLPFAGGRFDAAVSGFAISHIDAPQNALREMRRVVRTRGRVIVAVFGEAPASASKDAVDEVARDFGYQPPDWYVQLKMRTEPRSNTPALLAECAETAGLDDIEITDVVVEPGVDTPDAIAAYRIGLAHIAPFVASLPDPTRIAFVERAVAAVRTRGQAVRPRVLVLSSRVPA